MLELIHFHAFLSKVGLRQLQGKHFICSLAFFPHACFILKCGFFIALSSFFSFFLSDYFFSVPSESQVFPPQGWGSYH